MNKIRIGTRGSRLALRQASLVQEALQKENSGIETEVVVLHTKGDKIQDRPLSEIGDKGIFASEFEQALLENTIDIAVHSAKDLPVVLAEGLTIAAVLPRDDVRDVLVIPKGGRLPWEDMQRTFIIGSGSRRRQLQAEQLWKNVTCENIRGNVDTRMRKLQEESYDGIILAKAGLDRLGIGNASRGSDEYTFYPLPPKQFLPAACQGIIAIEAVQDSDVYALCRKITDAETELSFLIEREVLAQLSADCSEAAAAWCRREQEGLTLDIMYAGNRQRFTAAKVSCDGVWEYEVCPMEDCMERRKICLVDDMEEGSIRSIDNMEEGSIRPIDNTKEGSIRSIDNIEKGSICPIDNMEKSSICLVDDMEKGSIRPTDDMEEGPIRPADYAEGKKLHMPPGDMAGRSTYTTEIEAGLDMARQASALMKREGKERI